MYYYANFRYDNYFATRSLIFLFILIIWAKSPRPPNWKKSAAGPPTTAGRPPTTAAGPRKVRQFRGGRRPTRAPADDRQLKKMQKLRPPTTAAVARRKSAGRPRARRRPPKKLAGPPTTAKIFVIFPVFGGPAAVVAFSKLAVVGGRPPKIFIFAGARQLWRSSVFGGRRRAPAKIFHFRGRPPKIFIFAGARQILRAVLI